MNKVPPFTLILLFLAFSFAWGQNDAPLVVMECQGKIKYYPPEKGKPRDLAPGMLIEPDGMLKPQKGATLQVLNRIEVVQATLSAKATVRDAVPAPASGGRFGFGGNFVEMVSKTILATAPASTTDATPKGAGGDEPPPPPNTRKGAGGDEPPPPPSTRKGAGGDEPPPPPNTRKGAGAGEAMLFWNFPVKGKMHVTGQIPFSWDGYFNGTGPWKFSISEFGSDEMIYTAETTEPFHSINTIQGKLSIGKSYVWRVQPSNRTELMKAYSFSLVQESAEKGVLDVVEMEPDYQKAGPVQKLLWEAYAFEEGEFFNKADSLYKEALRLEPSNQLAINLYKAFWARNW